jgi:hypothetical protein
MPTITATPALPAADLPATPAARYEAACRDNSAALPSDLAFRGAKYLYEENALARASIEARLLANQPVGGIAARTLIPMPVISAFETWFFNVRSRLADAEWIYQHAIGRRSLAKLDRDEVGAFWRWYGYTHDALTLDNLLQNSDSEKLIKFGLAVYLQVNVPIGLATKLLIAGELMPELKSAELLRPLERIAEVPNWRAEVKAAGIKEPIVLKVLQLYAAAARSRQRRMNRSSGNRRPRHVVQPY